MIKPSNMSWATHTLEDLCERVAVGIATSVTKHYRQTGVPIIRNLNIKPNNLDESEILYITPAFAEANKTKAIKYNDILIVRTGNAGQACLVPKHLEQAQTFTTLIVTTNSNKLSPAFLCQHINSSLGIEQVKRLTGNAGRGNLNAGEFINYTLEVPSIREQLKIAEILSPWDTSIEQTENLIDLNITRKRGLMQQLLTGKKRFQEYARRKWELMSVSDFTTQAIRVRPKPDKAFLALGIRSHGKGTFLKPDFDPAKIEMTELYEVRENDLIVNITFAWEGAIAIAKGSDTGALVSHRFPTYEFNRELAVPEYFRHVIVQKWFVERLGLISPGGAGRNRVLSKRDFGKIEVLMPMVDEQRRIADVLNACDKEIDLLKQQLDTLKRQKRGLMQKLFTGQIRVKADDIEAAVVEAG